MLGCPYVRLGPALALPGAPRAGVLRTLPPGAPGAAAGGLLARGAQAREGPQLHGSSSCGFWPRLPLSL